MTDVKPAFASVVLDVDSTISAIEGVDWLALRRGEDVAQRVASLTDDAMRGAIPLESVYGARLAAIRPTRADIDALSRAYIEAVAPECPETVARLRAAGVRIVVISGGLRQAILPLARELEVAEADVYAVYINFDAAGDYEGFDEASPLATSAGKPKLLATLGLPRPILAVGDGSTDLAMRGVADTFAAFTGFIARDSVVARADVVLESFTQLQEMILKPQDNP